MKPVGVSMFYFLKPRPGYGVSAGALVENTAVWYPSTTQPKLWAYSVTEVNDVIATHKFVFDSCEQHRTILLSLNGL
jgi:hypothetical protein